MIRFSMIHARRIHPDAELPKRMTPDAAGYDFRHVGGGVLIDPGETVRIPLGWSLELPRGWCGLLLPRSSWTNRIDIKHPPIDADYRGEIHAIVLNTTEDKVPILAGDRFCQLLITSALTSDLVEVSYLTPTARDVGGFGSTDD